MNIDIRNNEMLQNMKCLLVDVHTVVDVLLVDIDDGSRGNGSLNVNQDRVNR